MKEQLLNRISACYGKSIENCSASEIYEVLLQLTAEHLQNLPPNAGKKQLYYISAEFLIGKLLSNNLIALGEYDALDALLRTHGTSLAQIEEAEPEPSLGNGGLGRLAACFLDSIATLGLPGAGIGLNYHLGLFRQTFAQRQQCAVPDAWIAPQSWLHRQPTSYEVPFGSCTVRSTLYDIDVAGYGGGLCKLHLFDLDTVDESIVHDGILFDKQDISRNLTLFLYPDDSDQDGQLLRIYQQYFMVSNAAQLILDEAISKGCKLHDLADYVVIQINDTHPSMIIPELIRLLQLRSIALDEAIAIVSSVCAYTNHTILAEALETWPLAYLEQVVPHLIPIIQELHTRIAEKYADPTVDIIDEDERVHMAHMDIHYGFSVNGVAALHTEILKNSELHPFHVLYPNKFNNKTNGITFRRWLLHCNHPLANLLTELIGDGYKKDAQELQKLLAYQDDPAVLQRLLQVKSDAKHRAVSFLRENTGRFVPENSIFDIQIKRLHEYKRQQMNALYIIDKYLEIKSGKLPPVPITCIFGAKAAPAYRIAQDIIHLLLCLQDLTANDAQVSPWLRVIMVENYNVTAAEKLIPACDLSEQISLASKEASGTGNMKFMLNGAVTLGTMDGANVEIADLAGAENIYSFGASSQEVIQHYEEKDYSAFDFYAQQDRIGRLVDFLMSRELIALGNRPCLARLHKELIAKDWFMTLLDLEAYIAQKDRAIADYTNRTAWAKKMLINIANAGFFSSDRTIAQYNDDIWHLT